MRNVQRQLSIFTIIFFAIGMIHISFSLLGLLCFVVPFIQYYIYKDKVWCKYYCPRAGYFNLVMSKLNIGKKVHKIFLSDQLKRGIVTYFIINLFFVTMSTIMVSLGRIEPIEQIRFLIVLPLPIDMPQLLQLDVPETIIHLGYRIYSIMFSSVIIGSLIGIMYKPRSWCRICPVNTLTSNAGGKKII